MSKEFSHLDGVDLNDLSDEDIEKLSNEEYNFLLGEDPELDEAVAKRNAWMDEQIDQGDDLGTLEDFMAPEEPQYVEDDLKTSEQLIAEDRAARERLQKERDIFGPLGAYKQMKQSDKWGGIDPDSTTSDLKLIRQTQAAGGDLQEIKPFLSPDSKYLNYIDAVSPPKSTDDTPDWAKDFLEDTSGLGLFESELDQASREIEAFPWQDKEWLRYLSPDVLRTFGPKNIFTTDEYEYKQNQDYRKNLRRQKKAAEKYEEDFKFTPLENATLFAEDFGEALVVGAEQGVEEIATQIYGSREYFDDFADSMTSVDLADKKVMTSELKAIDDARNNGSLSQYLSSKGWTKPFRKQLSEFWNKGETGNAINYLFAKAASTATSSFVPQMAAGTGTALALSAVAAPTGVVAGAGLGIAALVGAIQSGSGKYLETLIETKGDRDKALENGLKASAITGGTSALGMGVFAKLSRRIGAGKVTNFIERMFLSRALSPKNARLLTGAGAGLGLAIGTEVGSELADEALQQTYIDKKFNPETDTFLDPDALTEAAVLSFMIGGLGKVGGAFNFLTSDISETEIRKAIEAQESGGKYNAYDEAFIRDRKAALNPLQRFMTNLAGDQILLDPLFKTKVEESAKTAKDIGAATTTKDKQDTSTEETTPEAKNTSPLQESTDNAPDEILTEFGANPKDINLEEHNIDPENMDDVKDILDMRKNTVNMLYRMGQIEDVTSTQFENAVAMWTASASALRRQGKIKRLGELSDIVTVQVFNDLSASRSTADAAAVTEGALRALGVYDQDIAKEYPSTEPRNPALEGLTDNEILEQFDSITSKFSSGEDLTTKESLILEEGRKIKKRILSGDSGIRLKEDEDSDPSKFQKILDKEDDGSNLSEEIKKDPASALKSFSNLKSDYPVNRDQFLAQQSQKPSFFNRVKGAFGAYFSQNKEAADQGKQDEAPKTGKGTGGIDQKFSQDDEVIGDDVDYSQFKDRGKDVDLNDDPFGSLGDYATIEEYEAALESGDIKVEDFDLEGSFLEEDTFQEVDTDKAEGSTDFETDLTSENLLQDYEDLGFEVGRGYEDLKGEQFYSQKSEDFVATEEDLKEGYRLAQELAQIYDSKFKERFNEIKDILVSAENSLEEFKESELQRVKDLLDVARDLNDDGSGFVSGMNNIQPVSLAKLQKLKDRYKSEIESTTGSIQDKNIRKFDLVSDSINQPDVYFTDEDTGEIFTFLESGKDPERVVALYNIGLKTLREDPNVAMLSDDPLINSARTRLRKLNIFDDNLRNSYEAELRAAFEKLFSFFKEDSTNFTAEGVKNLEAQKARVNLSDKNIDKGFDNLDPLKSSNPLGIQGFLSSDLANIIESNYDKVVNHLNILKDPETDFKTRELYSDAEIEVFKESVEMDLKNRIQFLKTIFNESFQGAFLSEDLDAKFNDLFTKDGLGIKKSNVEGFLKLINQLIAKSQSYLDFVGVKVEFENTGKVGAKIKGETKDRNEAIQNLTSFDKSTADLSIGADNRTMLDKFVSEINDIRDDYTQYRGRYTSSDKTSSETAPQYIYPERMGVESKLQALEDEKKWIETQAEAIKKKGSGLTSKQMVALREKFIDSLEGRKLYIDKERVSRDDLTGYKELLDKSEAWIKKNEAGKESVKESRMSPEELVKINAELKEKRNEKIKKVFTETPKPKSQAERTRQMKNVGKSVAKVLGEDIVAPLETLTESLEDGKAKQDIQVSLLNVQKSLLGVIDNIDGKVASATKEIASRRKEYLKHDVEKLNQIVEKIRKFYEDRGIPLNPLSKEALAVIVEELQETNSDWSKWPDKRSSSDDRASKAARGMRLNKESRASAAYLYVHRRLLENTSGGLQTVQRRFGDQALGNKVPSAIYRTDEMKNFLTVAVKHFTDLEKIHRGVNQPPNLNAPLFQDYKKKVAALNDKVRAAKKAKISERDAATLETLHQSIKDAYGKKSEISKRITQEKRELEVHDRLMFSWGLDEGALSFDRSKTGEVNGQILSNPTTGKYVIQIFASGDIRTLFHEQAHLLREILGDDSSDLVYIRNIIGMGADDRWDEQYRGRYKFEEKFAVWMENFALNWKDQPEKSKKVWTRIGDWLARAFGLIKNPEMLYSAMNQDDLIKAYGDFKNKKGDSRNPSESEADAKRHFDAISEEMRNRTLRKWLINPNTGFTLKNIPEGVAQHWDDLWHSYMLDRSWALAQARDASEKDPNASILTDPTFAFRQMLGSSGKVYNYLTKGFYNPYTDEIDTINTALKNGGSFDPKTGHFLDANGNQISGVMYRKNIHDMMELFKDLHVMLENKNLAKPDRDTLDKLSNRFELKDRKKFSSFLSKMYNMKHSDKAPWRREFDNIFKDSPSAKKLVNDALAVYETNLLYAKEYLESSGIKIPSDIEKANPNRLDKQIVKTLSKSPQFSKIDGLAESMVFITKAAVEIGDINRTHLTLKDMIGSADNPDLFGRKISATEFKLLSPESKKSAQLVYTKDDDGNTSKEYWVYSPAIQMVFDSVRQDGIDEGLMGVLQIVGEFGEPFTQFSRKTITYGLPFLWRNPVRDVFSVAIQSRTARRIGLWNYVTKYLPSATKAFLTQLAKGKKTDFGLSKDVPMSTFMRELSGGGFIDQFDDSQEAYYRALSSQMADYVKTGTDLVIKPYMFQNVIDFLKSIRDRIPFVRALNSKTIAASEALARNMEYEAAYDYFISQGYPPIEARFRATAEQMDTLDFAKMGLAMRHVNKWVLFSNASIQGLWRTLRSVSDDTFEGVTRKGISKNLRPIVNAWLIGVLIPRLAIRGLGYAIGGEEEDRERMKEPAEVRDTFITLNVGKLFGDENSSFKFRKPQPFEHSVVAAGVDRFIDSQLYDDENAFTGFGKSLVNTFIPFTAGSLAGPFELIPQLLLNRKFYTDTPIIPEGDLGLSLEERRGNKHFGPAISYIQDLTQWDARNIDFALKDMFAYFGSTASAIDKAFGRGSMLPEQGVVGFTLDKVFGAGLYQTPHHDKNVRTILDEKGNKDLKAEYRQINSMINTWYSYIDEEDLQKAIELRKKIQKKANQIVNNKRDKFKNFLLF